MKIINIEKKVKKVEQIGVGKWRIDYSINAWGTEEILAETREEAEEIIDQMPTTEMDPEFNWDDFHITRSVQLDGNDDEIYSTEAYY